MKLGGCQFPGGSRGGALDSQESYGKSYGLNDWHTALIGSMTKTHVAYTRRAPESLP
jgi:hypothetical protein